MMIDGGQEVEISNNESKNFTIITVPVWLSKSFTLLIHTGINTRLSLYDLIRPSFFMYYMYLHVFMYIVIYVYTHCDLHVFIHITTYFYTYCDFSTYNLCHFHVLTHVYKCVFYTCNNKNGYWILVEWPSKEFRIVSFFFFVLYNIYYSRKEVFVFKRIFALKFLSYLSLPYLILSNNINSKSTVTQRMSLNGVVCRFLTLSLRNIYVSSL